MACFVRFSYVVGAQGAGCRRLRRRIVRQRTTARRAIARISHRVEACGAHARADAKCGPPLREAAARRWLRHRTVLPAFAPGSSSSPDSARQPLTESKPLRPARSRAEAAASLSASGSPPPGGGCGLPTSARSNHSGRSCGLPHDRANPFGPKPAECPCRQMRASAAGGFGPPTSATSNLAACAAAPSLPLAPKPDRSPAPISRTRRPRGSSRVCGAASTPRTPPCRGGSSGRPKP